MKHSVTFSASPSFAALRLLAFDSSTPKIMLATAPEGPAPCLTAAGKAMLGLPAPCYGIYALQQVKNTGVHYLYDLQIRDHATAFLSCHLEFYSLMTRLPRHAWAGDS